jgi:Tol biopolymer transport system component
MIDLRADNTYLSTERLTENTNGFAEWNPAFSPDGSHIAYLGGAVRKSGGVQDANIYSLVPATHSVTQLTKGNAASLRNNPMWSPDGAWIGFNAYTSGTRRSSTCPGLVNSEIFLIKADGSTAATQITNTNGTSVEVWPRWGR